LIRCVVINVIDV